LLPGLSLCICCLVSAVFQEVVSGKIRWGRKPDREPHQPVISIWCGVEIKAWLLYILRCLRRGKQRMSEEPVDLDSASSFVSTT
jgi:hypothetical protein